MGMIGFIVSGMSVSREVMFVVAEGREQAKRLAYRKLLEERQRLADSGRLLPPIIHEDWWVVEPVTPLPARGGAQLVRHGQLDES